MRVLLSGARGLLFFGGNVEQGLNERDKALGWNWSENLRPIQDARFALVYTFMIAFAAVPVLLFCAVFGMSMDYEVLMLSRMREEYLRTLPDYTEEDVAGSGFAITGYTVTPYIGGVAQPTIAAIGPGQLDAALMAAVEPAALRAHAADPDGISASGRIWTQGRCGRVHGHHGRGRRQDGRADHPGRRAYLRAAQAHRAHPGGAPACAALPVRRDRLSIAGSRMMRSSLFMLLALLPLSVRNGAAGSPDLLISDPCGIAAQA